MFDLLGDGRQFKVIRQNKGNSKHSCTSSISLRATIPFLKCFVKNVWFRLSTFTTSDACWDFQTFTVFLQNKSRLFPMTGTKSCTLFTFLSICRKWWSFYTLLQMGDTLSPNLTEFHLKHFKLFNILNFLLKKNVRLSKPN